MNEFAMQIPHGKRRSCVKIKISRRKPLNGSKKPLRQDNLVHFSVPQKFISMLTVIFMTGEKVCDFSPVPLTAAVRRRCSLSAT